MFEVNKYGINVKYMHANQLFKLLTTIKRAVDDRRQKQVDLSDQQGQQIKVK